MKTTGTGTEGYMIVLPAIALVVVASLAAGGPTALIHLIDQSLRTGWQVVVDFYYEVL